MNDAGGWRELGIAVLLQAVKDAKGRDEVKALDAVLWLISEDVPLWLDAVGLPDADAVRLVTAGNVRRLKRLYGWRAKSGRAKGFRGLNGSAGAGVTAAHIGCVASATPRSSGKF